MDKGAFIKKKRKERGYTQLQLSEIADLDERTVRRIENNEKITVGIKSLNKIFDVLDISISDRQRMLGDDDLDYRKIAEINKKNQLFINNQVFNQENISYLRSLLQQVGVTCDISSYGWFKQASVKNEYELSSIQLDFNLRLLDLNKTTVLHIINFYVMVNQALLNETVIKDALIKSLEIYARKLGFNEIWFTIDQDFKKVKNQYFNSQSEIPTDFTYSLGTESSLFAQNDYKRSSYPEFEKFQVEWRKTLS